MGLSLMAVFYGGVTWKENGGMIKLPVNFIRRAIRILTETESVI